MARKRLGELLLEAGVIDKLQLQSALGEQRKFGAPLGRVLVEMHLVSEDAMVNVLSRQLNLPSIQLNGLRLEDPAIELLDMEFCNRHNCIPFAYQERGKFLDVAMADPTNQETFDQIRVKTRCNVRPYLAGPVSIDSAIRTAYGEAHDRLGHDWQQDQKWSAPQNERVIELQGSGAPAQKPGQQQGRRPRNLSSEIKAAVPAVPAAAAAAAPGEVDALRGELAELRAMLERDEKVLRRLMGLVVDKGLCTRQELLTRISEK